MRRDWLIAATVMLVWFLIVIRQPLFSITQITPQNEAAIQRDWWLYNGVSGVEYDGLTAYRWLVAQPKDSYAQLNRQIDQSLVHTSVVLAQMLGQPSWRILCVRLSSVAPKSVQLHGVARTLTWQLALQKRVYRMVIPYTVVPAQSHLISLANRQYDTFGFTSAVYEQDTADPRARIARWYGTTLTPVVAPAAVWLWCIMVFGTPMAWAWWVCRHSVTHLCGMVGGLALLGVVAIWGMELWHGVALSLAPLHMSLCTVSVWYGMRWVNPRLARRWPVLTIGVIYVLAWLMDGMHAYAVSQWMQGVDFATLPTWVDFGVYVAQMRMAMPIPLLTVEYLLYRSGIPGVLTVVYLTLCCRIFMLFGIVWALYAPVRTQRHAIVATVIASIIVAGVAFVSRYYDRNVWMVYDALFAMSVLVIWHMLRRLPETPSGWVMIGCALVWLDALRPFMLVLTPFFVFVVARMLVRRHGWSALVWMGAPLSLSVIWHLYHGLVLGQWSWSSHSGFNVARAWLPTLAAQVMATHLPDMNSPTYATISAGVLHQTVKWILLHPSDALVRAQTLLATMLSIPVETMRLSDHGTYNVLTRVIPWYIWAYRVVMCGALLMQLVAVVLMRHWRHPALWLNAVVVWLIIGVMSMSEYGEQARFLVSIAPLAVYVSPGMLLIFHRLIYHRNSVSLTV